MKIKKISKLIIIIMFLLSTIVCANNVDEEQIDLTQINEEVAQATSDATTVPDINSRSAIVLERSTRDYFVWQKCL